MLLSISFTGAVCKHNVPVNSTWIRFTMTWSTGTYSITDNAISVHRSFQKFPQGMKTSVGVERCTDPVIVQLKSQGKWMNVQCKWFIEVTNNKSLNLMFATMPCLSNDIQHATLSTCKSPDQTFSHMWRWLLAYLLQMVTQIFLGGSFGCLWVRVLTWSPPEGEKNFKWPIIRTLHVKLSNLKCSGNEIQHYQLIA